MVAALYQRCLMGHSYKVKSTMKIKEFPLMHKFIHGAFSANSGGQYESTGESECYIEHPPAATPDPIDVQAQWDEAEQWLRDFSGWCDGMPMALRFIFWLGMEADNAVTIMVQGTTTVQFQDTDGLVKAPPYKLLDCYY